MSNYRRLISYIYAYEGGIKGKNIGFAKIETRGIQCKITVSVKKVYVGGNDIGVYLLAGEQEIFLGNIFIRGGSGEFRTVVTVSDVEHSGIPMDQCYGLTVHDVENTWRSYTTIWEDAVAHAAEVELSGAVSEKREAEEAVQEARIRKAMKEIEEEFPVETAKEPAPNTYIPTGTTEKMLEKPIKSADESDSQEHLTKKPVEIQMQRELQTESHPHSYMEPQPTMIKDVSEQAAVPSAPAEERPAPKGKQYVKNRVLTEAYRKAPDRGAEKEQVNTEDMINEPETPVKPPVREPETPLWGPAEPTDDFAQPINEPSNTSQNYVRAAWGENETGYFPENPTEWGRQEQQTLREESEPQEWRRPQVQKEPQEWEMPQAQKEPQEWETSREQRRVQEQLEVPDQSAREPRSVSYGYPAYGGIPAVEYASELTPDLESAMQDTMGNPICHRADTVNTVLVNPKNWEDQVGGEELGERNSPEDPVYLEEPELLREPELLKEPEPLKELELPEEPELLKEPAMSETPVLPENKKILSEPDQQTNQESQVIQETQPVPGDPKQLERLLQKEEEDESSSEQVWEKLKRTHTKILDFDYEKGCEILTIKPQDIGLLPRDVWVFGNNSFLLHGYYNYRYLILAKLFNPEGEPRYLLGVPGHYYSNERYMASMFGFPNFVLSKNQPIEDGRFGYWYTDIKIGN